MLARHHGLAAAACLVALTAACSTTTDVPRSAAAASPATATPAPVAAPTVAPTPAPTADQRVILQVHYHRQRDPDWCDPADLQMWLELDGVSVGSTDEVTVQQQLWNYEVGHNDGFTLAQWHASPYAVAAAFDHFANRSDVGDMPFNDAPSAGAVISASIAGKHEPVIALVDAGNHYVLVYGVTLGPAGLAAPPASVTVSDPWAYGPTRGDYPAMGATVELAWAEFVKRFNPDDPHDLGIWPGHWVLIGAGLPLRG